MSVPTQRAPDPTSGGGESAMWQVLRAVERVDDSVERLAADMAARFDKLDDRYMPRRELMTRFDESFRDRADLRTQLSTARTQADADLATLGARIDAADARRVADRRWAVGVLLTILGLLLSIAGLVLAQIP